jgi:hypothetical protein
MNDMTYSFQQFGLFILLLVFVKPVIVWGQCEQFQIMHLNGTVTVGCTEVTVTSNGSVGTNNYCGYAPYLIGPSATGSYTFSFSPAVSEVWISLGGINNNSAGLEELSFEINGNFYPIVNPGMDDGCRPPAMITLQGTIRANPGAGNAGASWQEVLISETINTLKIENIWLNNHPNGTVVQVVICCPPCVTDAGQITSAEQDLCLGDTVSLPFATDTVLDNNDLLQYILFSDLNDTIGSIIATNNTPTFGFNPATMQTGVEYFIAALAGNDLNGNVDLNDPCLDLSNVITVTWHPLPTVTFSVENPDVCVGRCQIIDVAFTGTPPFTLTVSSPAGTTTNTFQNYTGTLEICPPPGTPPGSFTVQATALTDAYCTCP